MLIAYLEILGAENGTIAKKTLEHSELKNDGIHDKIGGEVAQFTVLEELCDEFEDEEIDFYFKDSNYNEARKQIRSYIVFSQNNRLCKDNIPS